MAKSTKRNSVEVKREIKIKVGKKFNISPSEGWLGIEDGAIEVVEITDYDSVKDRFADPKVIVENWPKAKKYDWIVYRYLNGGDQAEEYAFDVETFVDHISMY